MATVSASSRPRSASLEVAVDGSDEVVLETNLSSSSCSPASESTLPPSFRRRRISTDGHVSPTRLVSSHTSPTITANSIPTPSPDPLVCPHSNVGSLSDDPLAGSCARVCVRWRTTVSISDRTRPIHSCNDRHCSTESMTVGGCEDILFPPHGYDLLRSTVCPCVCVCECVCVCL